MNAYVMPEKIVGSQQLKHKIYLNDRHLFKVICKTRQDYILKTFKFMTQNQKTFLYAYIQLVFPATWTITNHFDWIYNVFRDQLALFSIYLIAIAGFILCVCYLK